MKMKVQFKYRLPDYKYKQKTLLLEIPTDDSGFTQSKVLSKNIIEMLKTIENQPCVLLWHRIISR